MSDLLWSPVHFLTIVQLTALLVAELKADPELPHVTSREDVWDPLNHKRTGFLLISQARSCKQRINKPVHIYIMVIFKKKTKHHHLPTLRKVRSSMGRMAWGRSVLCPSGRSCSGGGSGQRKREYEPSMFFTKLWESSRGSWGERCWSVSYPLSNLNCYLLKHTMTLVILIFKLCTAAGMLRFQLWNLAHPSCQPLIENIFKLVRKFKWIP